MRLLFLIKQEKKFKKKKKKNLNHVFSDSEVSKREKRNTSHNRDYRLHDTRLTFLTRIITICSV